MRELAAKNAIASANGVGPMRFRSYWGPSSAVLEYGLMFEEINTGVLQSTKRFKPSTDEDITHTHTQSEVKLFT